ncbi:hypothetical protein EPN95_02210 [Patescibacteria group bacterium]|nr:MAG: hypothetical protein EPN95_02210 [Patescibacteria group bacterium]
MIKMNKLLLAFGLAIVSGGAVVTVIAPELTFAAPITSKSTPADCEAKSTFLTFPPWFRGLVQVKQTTPGVYECIVDTPKAGDLGGFVWHIVLNIIDIGLQIVAYLAAGFILWGGFQFLTSQGSPEVAAKARKSILDATIGLGISIASIAAVNLISGILIYNP